MQRPFAPAVIAAMLVAVFPARVFAQQVPESLYTFTAPFEVSCDTLVVADYSPSDGLFSNNPVSVAFDRERCATQLHRLTASSLTKPLSEFLAAAKRDKGPDETAEETETRLAESHARFSATVLPALRTNLQPLFDVCRTVAPPQDAKLTRVCHFGFNRETASAPASAIFNTILYNRLSTEAICTPEPIGRQNIVLPEFAGFLRDGRSLTWPDIKGHLEKDGFVCGEDSCAGAFFSIMLLPKDQQRWATIFEGDFFLPRFVIVYRGKWQAVGPPGYQESIVPQRGSAGGICMTPEDSHQWGMLWMLVNGIR